ncbi:esterase [Streptomyces morookaense]|uniref:Esterase n=1 Tax=Streptomyces morookaense TaxID=1970 RepID=A0A7Y7B861_STRMO|nr:esterase [Streptomyces morookaense]NVK80351.1 esterase [Streptomyces morookaense]GHF10752.1 hypothetical protein GCM10010359_10380 [Streptomyces morookaense]
MPVTDPQRALRRRALVAAGVLALTGLVSAFTPTAHAAAATAAASPLPAPTGPYPVGTTTRHLTDTARPDPWHPERGPRQVMVSFWYPAARAQWRTAQRVAPHMDTLSAAHFGSAKGAGAFNYGVPVGSVDWAATRTHAVVDAPVARGTRVRPVVLYSAGLGDPRTWNTSLVEELASRGYVVVTVDHTYDSSEVLLTGTGPGRQGGRRLVESALPALARQHGTDPSAVLRKAMTARVDDTRFVLDVLDGHRQHPRPELPRTLTDAMDLHRIAMAGHSAGGFTALQAMHDDRRIGAAVDMDGTLAFPDGRPGSVARDGVDRPFLLMGTESADSGSYRRQPSWAALWQHSRGWRGDLTLLGSRHGAYTDAAALLPGAASREVLRKDVGTVRPERAVAATRAAVVTFLDRFLRGRESHMLDGFPELRPEGARGTARPATTNRYSTNNPRAAARTSNSSKRA